MLTDSWCAETSFFSQLCNKITSWDLVKKGAPQSPTPDTTGSMVRHLKALSFRGWKREPSQVLWQLQGKGKLHSCVWPHWQQPVTIIALWSSGMKGLLSIYWTWGSFQQYFLTYRDLTHLWWLRNLLFCFKGYPCQLSDFNHMMWTVGIRVL